MANINWGTLGSTIKDKYTDFVAPVTVGSGFSAGMKDIANTLDMYNREQAVGQMLTQRISAQKAKIRGMQERLMKLKQQLSDSVIKQSETPVEGQPEDAGNDYNYAGIFGLAGNGMEA